jgi:predicted DNA-binding transcriptional regulator YafY
LLLLAVDRLTGLKVSPGGVEATLSQVKAQALGEISEIEDREAAEAARAQILQAESPDQVQAAMAMAVELNVNRVMERVKEAIHQKRKVYVRYRPDPQGPVEIYQVACLDVKPGKTPATRANDYLWVYSYEHESVISLRLGRVLGVELSEETFDPAELMADWRKREPEWNVPRDW